MSEQIQPTCPYTGKIAYPNPQKAWTAANRINRKRALRVIGGRRRHGIPYKCSLCHLWHLYEEDKHERKARDQ